jgi:hypothetical protein
MDLIETIREAHGQILVCPGLLGESRSDSFQLDLQLEIDNVPGDLGQGDEQLCSLQKLVTPTPGKLQGFGLSEALVTVLVAEILTVPSDPIPALFGFIEPQAETVPL